MEGSKRILLVDEDLDHLLFCNLVLTKGGYRVKVMVGCKHVDEFMQVVESFIPDVIIMEHDLEQLCGKDLVRILRQHRLHSKIPVIYFSSRQDIASIREETGADFFLLKPGSTEQVLDMVEGCFA